MKHQVSTVEWSLGEQRSERVQSRMHRLMTEGQLGEGDRARRRLGAGLWLQQLYELGDVPSHAGNSTEAPLAAPLGFSEPKASPLAPSPAWRGAFERAAAAMGPEFGVLYQTCCLNQKTRPSLLCRALDRLIDWLDPLRARQAR